MGGRKKVLQSLMKARQAGYFCLFLIVEKMSTPDSMFDIADCLWLLGASWSA
jgi:hypothetical protein